MALTLFVALVFIALASLFVYLQRQSSYWKRQNVKTFGNLFSGCFKEAFNGTKSLADILTEYHLQTRNEKYIGTFLFGKPILIINDPEIVKGVLVSDFNDFNSRGFYYDFKRDPISGNLFLLEGSDWKSMRTKLSPIFSTGKVKYMFDTMLSCVKKLNNVIDPEKESVVDTRLAMSSLSIDVIASVGFGIEANSLENPNAEFGNVCRSVNKGSFVGFIKFLIQTNMHWLAKLINLQSLDRPTDSFFKKVVRETVSYRETNNVSRNDFIDLMIRMKNSGGIEGSLHDPGHSAKEVTIDDIVAQAFIFFIAGFESTSQANTFALFELARHPAIQRRVQIECAETLKKSNGEITFDAVNGMEYTEQVLREVMRLYPALQVLNRSPLKKCKIPTTDIEVDTDTAVWIPLAALQRDPDVFVDPSKFDPERFSKENKSGVPPFIYMPFGDGPRICIGMRFALVQMKTVMLYLLSQFDVNITKDTPQEVKLNPRNFFPNPMGKFTLKFTPRKVSLD